MPPLARCSPGAGIAAMQLALFDFQKDFSTLQDNCTLYSLMDRLGITIFSTICL